MDEQLRSFLANLSSEATTQPKPQPGPQTKPSTQAADEEVQMALAICNGDAVEALRITLIANAFLEAEIEDLKAQIAAGLQRKRNAARVKVENPTRAKKTARALKA